MKILTARKLMTRLLIAAGVLGCIMFACLFVGSEPVHLCRVLEGPSFDVPNMDYLIFMQVRLPRVLLAAIVGAALACAGVVFQAILRNPLADPYILGISSGAGLGIILAVMGGWTLTVAGMSPLMVAAFVGAIGTVWLVWGIGRVTGRTQVAGLLLAGVVVNAFFSAMIMFLTAFAQARQLQTTLFWLMGSLAEVEHNAMLYAAGGLCLSGVIFLMLLGGRLNILSFGAEQAAAMGVSIRRTSLLAFACAALMTSVAVSFSGLIGFVGLIVPHAVRLIAGPDHRQLIPLSAFAGAAFLVLADSVARVIVAPAMLPVGVVTALAGGPFFLVLLVRYTKNIHWGQS
jgi:iron complex transport system permease protein